MKKLSQARQFVRDVKRMDRRGKDLEKLKEVVRRLACGESLDPRCRDHSLGGEWRSCRDCHIEADWVLIYSMDAEFLCLQRTGTHSDLFR